MDREKDVGLIVVVVDVIHQRTKGEDNMALRKWHLFWGEISFLTYMTYAKIIINYPSSWIMVGILLAMVGSEFADLDQIVGWLNHRDIITHSILIPLLLIFLAFYNQYTTLEFRLIVAPFLIGYGSHLWLDLFPTINPERTLKKKGIWYASIELFGTAIQGISSAQIVSHVGGTYLIHTHTGWLGYKTLGKHKTRWWLFFSGLFCIGIILFF